MASFTDTNIPQFNPYVQQLPVEAMVEVGVAKQQMYNEGITKVQSEVDKLAGMDIARDVDRAYLQSKINELGNNLKYFMASDFSDFQLTNSVAGMTKQVGNDPNVINAVSSTAKYRKQVGLMEGDREKGTLSPDNEYHFSKQANSWLTNSDVKQSFNGRYVPHYDVFKHVKESFDALKPDGYSFDQIYQLGPDGNPLTDRRGNLILSPHMTRMEKEGMFPEKVKQTLDQVFADPRVNQQLQISGEYNYRNYAPEQLIAAKIEPQRVEQIRKYQSAIDELKIKNAVGPKNAENDDMIASLETELSTVNGSYTELMQLAKTNPDLVSGMIYKTEAKDRYAKMFGWEKTKQQILDNPAWKAQFDMQKEANDQSRFAQRLAFDVRKSEKDDLKWQMKFEQDERLALLKNAKAGAKGLGDASIYNPTGALPDFENPIDVVMFNENEIDVARNDYQNSSNELVWKLLYETGTGEEIEKNQRILNKQLQKTINGKPVTREQAIANIIKQTVSKKGISIDEYMTGATQRALAKWNTLTPEQQRASQITNDKIVGFVQASKKWKSELAIQKRINTMAGSEFAKFDNVNFQPSVVKGIDGRDYELTKQDAIDLALYGKNLELGFFDNLLGGDETKAIISEGSAAKKRLESRGKLPLLQSFEKSFVPDKDDRKTLDRGAIDFYLTGMPTEHSHYLTNRGKFNSVYNFYDTVSKDYGKVMSKKAEVIKAVKGVPENLTLPITTGNAEDDRKVLADVKGLAGIYATAGQNVSPTFDDFLSKINSSKKMEDVVIKAGVTKDAQGAPSPSIVLFDGDERYEMAITNQELNSLGYDINQLYESPEVRQVRNLITANGGKTSSSQNYLSKETYVNGDYLYNNNDFPLMSSSTKHSTKVNIIQSGGMYYPVIYASNGEKSVVRELSGNANLEATILTLKQTMSPKYIDLLIQ